MKKFINAPADFVDEFLEGIITAHPDLERRCLESAVDTPQGRVCGLEVGVAIRILSGIRDLAESVMRQGIQPVLLTSPQARRLLRRLIARDFPGIPVISHPEIPRGISVEVLGQVVAEAELSAA